jgi:hypothetical protein
MSESGKLPDSASALLRSLETPEQQEQESPASFFFPLLAKVSSHPISPPLSPEISSVESSLSVLDFNPSKPAEETSFRCFFVNFTWNSEQTIVLSTKLNHFSQVLVPFLSFFFFEFVSLPKENSAFALSDSPHSEDFASSQSFTALIDSFGQRSSPVPQEHQNPTSFAMFFSFFLSFQPFPRLGRHQFRLRFHHKFFNKFYFHNLLKMNQNNKKTPQHHQFNHRHLQKPTCRQSRLQFQKITRHFLSSHLLLPNHHLHPYSRLRCQFRSRKHARHQLHNLPKRKQSSNKTF